MGIWYSEGNANYAWIQHMIYHLNDNGRIGLVLANGSLSSQSGGEGDIRRKLIEADLVEGIVAMPSQLFYNVQIPCCLWFFNKRKLKQVRHSSLTHVTWGTCLIAPIGDCHPARPIQKKTKNVKKQKELQMT